MPEISPVHNQIAHNQLEYSVSEISGAMKRLVEDAFGYVRVRGELSGYRGAHSSGHCYFTLKDDKSVLSAVIWKGNFQRLAFKPEEGMEVIATGKITTYPGKSNYQIVIERMEPAGIGALMAMLEKRKAMLAAEGLFDPSRKRPLPFLPEVIGVVTSPTGAVIRDILHRIADRFPRRVIVWPVAVQGEGAAEQIAAAIRGFNSLPPFASAETAFASTPRPDVLIVARGGGSIEDLWAFNEEVVVRATAESAIPLISAVGHETDTTLIDHAADRRAPTPTAAAEMAVPVRGEWVVTVLDFHKRLTQSISRNIRQREEALAIRARLLPRLLSTTDTASQALDEWAGRLQTALPNLVRLKRLKLENYRLQPHLLAQEISRKEDRLAQAAERAQCAYSRLLNDRQRAVAQQARLLQSLNYERILERGFALVRDEAQGGPVTAAAQLQPEQAITLQFRDGQRKAMVVS